MFLETRAPKVWKFELINRRWWKYPKASFLRIFTIRHTWCWYASFAKPFGNNFERAVFNKISALQFENAVKTKFYSQIVAKNFACFLGTANIRNDSFLLTRFLVKLCDDLCLVACLNKILVLVGKHFFCYFKDNLGAHISLFTLETFHFFKHCLLFKSFNVSIKIFQTIYWTDIL